MPALLVLLGILVIGGGAYYIGQQNAAPLTEQNSPQTSTTAMADVDVLPTQVGQCVVTKVTQVTTRLVGVPGSGSVIVYSAKTPEPRVEYDLEYGVQTSYSQIAGIDNSKVGDKVRLCLKSVPQNCPAGDHRGKEYTATNLRTNETWVAPDTEHMCGGA